MKFEAQFNHKPENRKLTYSAQDYSFGMEPSVGELDFEIALNHLCLTVVNKQIVDLDGFCVYGEWIKSDYEVPKAKLGILKILDDLQPGFSYGLNKEDWPIYVNVKTEWVCIGDPEHKGEAVEFIKNCIAVIDDKNLVSLWLKPESLPQEILQN